ncbi:MAG: regulatory protein [Frankiales bacterium]|nr:regulatory protein [Frankiales bacterium]
MSVELLRRVVRSLSCETDAASALVDLAGLLVPDLADWCVVDLLELPDLVTRVAAVGRDGPLALPVDMGIVDARRSSARSTGLLPRLTASPDRLLRLSGAQLRGLAASEDARMRSQAGLALGLGTTDLLVVGLVRREELLGVVTLGRTDGAFDDVELALVVDLAAVAGLALDGVRLLELQRGVSTALQRSLLPQLPTVPAVALAARFVPAGAGLAVGGDWYDAFVLPDGDLALVVGDATGHDVQAATRMAELRNLLRAVAVDAQDPPAGTLSRLDAVVALLAPELSGTCVYARLETHDAGRRLRWSSAGHLPPVLLRDGRAQLLETRPDLMLGVREGTTRRDHVQDVQAGDVLVLYTDGLVEDRRASLDDRLPVLVRLVEQAGAASLEHLADELVAQLATGDDDVAVLVVGLAP